MAPEKSTANELSLIVQHSLALIQNEEKSLKENREFDLHGVGSNGNVHSMPNFRSCTTTMTGFTTTTRYSTSSGSNSSSISHCGSGDNYDSQYDSKSNKRVKVSSCDQFQLNSIRPTNRSGRVNTSSNALAYERRCVIRQLERILKEIDYQEEAEIDQGGAADTNDTFSNIEQDSIVGNVVLIMTEILPHWLISMNSYPLADDYVATTVLPVSTSSAVSPLLLRVLNITHLSAKLIMHRLHPACLVQPPSDDFTTPILITIFTLSNKIHRNAHSFAMDVNRSFLSQNTLQVIQRESLLHLTTHLILILNTSVMFKSSSSGKLDEAQHTTSHLGSDPTMNEEQDQQMLLFPKLNSAQTIAFIVSLLTILLESNELFQFPCLSSAMEKDASVDSIINSSPKEVINFQFSTLVGDLFHQLLTITDISKFGEGMQRESNHLATLLSFVKLGSKPILGLEYFACDDELIEDFIELTNTFVSQTLENSTDAIHIMHTLWNRSNEQNSRPRLHYLDFEDAEEQQSIDEMLQQYQFTIQSIVLSVNLLENITPNQLLLQINIPQHLLFSFFHSFAVLIATGVCEDLLALEGARQRSREGTVAHSPPAGQLSKSEVLDMENHGGDESLELFDDVSTEVEAIISLKRMLLRLVKVISLASDNGGTSCEVQVNNIGLKRKVLALKLSLLSAFDTDLSLLEFMLQTAGICYEDRSLTGSGLCAPNPVPSCQTNVDLYETNKLLQAALYSKMMSSFKPSSSNVTTSTARYDGNEIGSSQHDEHPLTKHLVNATLHSTLNPWNSFIVRSLPDETAKKKINCIRPCINTLLDMTSK